VPVREQQSERGLAHDHNGRMAHTLASRSDTTFSTVPGFVRDYDAFSIVEQASIGRYMNRFEVDFQISTMDMELRNGYQIEVQRPIHINFGRFTSGGLIDRSFSFVKNYLKPIGLPYFAKGSRESNER